MPENRSRTPARLLAPLALAVCAFALFLVLTGSGVTGGDDEDDGGRPRAKETTSQDTTDAKPKPRRKASYTVEVGDNLGLIAEKTGVDVETIELLNPELDPQALAPGQKIKLRE